MLKRKIQIGRENNTNKARVKPKNKANTFIKIRLRSLTSDNELSFYIIPKSDEYDENDMPIFDENAVRELAMYKKFVKNIKPAAVHLYCTFYENETGRKIYNYDDFTELEHEGRLTKLYENNYIMETQKRLKQYYSNDGKTGNNSAAVFAVIGLAAVLLATATALSDRNVTAPEDTSVSTATDVSSAETTTVQETTETSAAVTFMSFPEAENTSEPAETETIADRSIIGTWSYKIAYAENDTASGTIANLKGTRITFSANGTATVTSNVFVSLAGSNSVETKYSAKGGNYQLEPAVSQSAVFEGGEVEIIGNSLFLYWDNATLMFAPTEADEPETITDETTVSETMVTSEAETVVTNVSETAAELPTP